MAMKASYTWLKEFVDFNSAPEELGHMLTMAGLEVEAIEKTDKDSVFEIGVTPNRPDCLSIRGIARDISAILELPLKVIEVTLANTAGKGPDVKIDDPELCPRYTSRTIKGIKPGPSPEWLSDRLELCGIRPVSNIVDITNYVLLETGQPMHAFDLAALAGGKIVVKKAGETSEFITLDNETRKLSKEMLLIWDSEKPVAIAGVMGGLNTEVTDATTDILLESAYFDPSSIRKTSKTLNLSSESAYRFERGVDREAVSLAMDRAAQLITEIAGGTVSEITDEYPAPFRSKNIPVSLDKVNKIIGIDIEAGFVEKTLLKLGLKVERAGDVLTVVPPAFRPDIEMDIDIIEEVARIYGYDNIPSTLPVMQMCPAPVHRTREIIMSLKTSMVKSGYSEVINFSFMGPDALDMLDLPADDRRRELVYVKNPLRKEDSAMRTTLVPALLTNVNTNLNRGEKMLRFFEIAHVFLPSGKKLPDEKVQLCAVFQKEAGTALWQDKHDGFYDLKGVFENIFADLKISDVRFDPGSSESYMHPGKSCSIFIGAEKIGSAGALHPAVAEAFDVRGDINIAEIYDIKKLLAAVPSRPVFKQLQKFPYIERDIALIVDDTITVSEVEKEILSVESDIIEAVKLFDVYKGKPVPAEKKSLAFSIRYRSDKGTLTDNEVDALHADIIKKLTNRFKTELRN